MVTGGGPSADGSRWLPSRADFFVPDRALSKLCRARFRDAMKQAELFEQIDPAVWQKDWTVRTHAVGNGRTTLQYLAAYVDRVSIAITASSPASRARSRSPGESLSRRMPGSGSGRGRRMRLHAREFLRRFLQHVLPRGFQKVRHYGFLSPRSRQHLETFRWLVTVHARQHYVRRALQTPVPTPHRPRCVVPIVEATSTSRSMLSLR